MSDNGGAKTEERKKKCPFLGEKCIGDECEMRSELVKSAGGLPRKFTLCAVNALVLMISEMNAKAQLPQQKIELPKGFLRG